MDSNCEEQYYCENNTILHQRHQVEMLDKNYNWNDVETSENLTNEISFSNYILGLPSSTTNPYENHNTTNKSKLNFTQHRNDETIPKCVKNLTSAPPKIYKRRNTANKKERRRTQSINTAFSSLRNKIPNVPLDTKLSKIKTLRLATSYITYLKKVLEGDQDPAKGFQAELITSPKKHTHNNTERKNNLKNLIQIQIIEEFGLKKIKGRTGWPQDLWASELKQEAMQ